jgi:hypothetical protein
MAQYYDFAGARIILPGAYSDRSFPVDQGAGAVLGRVIVMGEASRGGVPYNAYPDVEDVINIVEGQAQALGVFGGGDVYYGAEFYLTPHKDARFNKPAEALCICTNQMGQATTILSGTTGAAAIIDVAYNKYGVDGNTAAIKLTSGTNAGKMIEMIYKGTSIIDKDDVDLDMMSIQYTGAGSAATITITATKLTTSCTGATTDNLDITLADYADLGSLINYINTQASYTCLLTGASDELTSVFDVVTAQAMKVTAYSCKGVVEAVIRKLNSTGDITAALRTGATRIVPDDLTEYQYLKGGSVSAATTADWIAALLMLEEYDCNGIVAMTGSAAIKLLVQDHVDRMNGVEVKKYRQAGSGAGTSQGTKALRIAETKALNSAYIEYCVSSFDRWDYVNKVKKTFDPYYLYPMIAGFRYANNVGMDVVFKYVNVLAATDISNKDQKDYAAAGATFIQKSTNVNSITSYEIKCNNTTYQGSQVTRTNPGCVYAINAFTKDFEEQVIEKLRALDSVANSVVIATIENWILTYLLPYYRDSKKWITDGTDGVQKAFENVSFAQSGEQFTITATITMSVTPRFALNFFTFIVPGQNV